MLTFYDYPAEHWVHLRTTNPIESTFATGRLRRRVTKGPGSRAAGIAMAYKLIESAQTRWRAVNAPHLVALVRARLRYRLSSRLNTSRNRGFANRPPTPFNGWLLDHRGNGGTASRYLAARSRCLHPGQQQGRRWPSSSSSCVRRMRRSRVLCCLASSTQQMNSLRAKGVMSLQASSAVVLAINASRRSAGRGCTTPPGSRWLLTGQR